MNYYHQSGIDNEVDFTVEDDGKHKEQYVYGPYRNRSRFGVPFHKIEQTKCACYQKHGILSIMISRYAGYKSYKYSKRQ